MRLFRPRAICETRRKHRARMALRRAWGAKPNDAKRLYMGRPMRSVLLVRSRAVPDLRRVGARRAATAAAEHLTVQPLPPTSPHWVYVYDEAFDNEIDARLHLFDGDSYRRLGRSTRAICRASVSRPTARPRPWPRLISRAVAAARAPTWSSSPTTGRSPRPAKSCCRPSAPRRLPLSLTSATAPTATSCTRPT